MSSTRRPPPPLLLTPRYCVTVFGQRWLEEGVFESRALAEMRAEQLRGVHCTLMREVFAVEPIFISRRNL